MRPRLFVFIGHLVGNALLLLLGYHWLGVGESDALHLASSAAVFLLFALAATWLHGTALVAFRRDETLGFTAAARRALKNVLPLLLLGMAVVLVYLALGHFYDSFGHQAFQIGSYSTMKLRRPVEPGGVLKAFHSFIWFLRWFAVPALAFSLAAALANNGWSGFRLDALQRCKSILFWIEAGLLTLAAVYLPLRLFYWIPAHA